VAENADRTGRPIVKVFNYLRVQKSWNPSGRVELSELYDNVGMSRPTLYSCLEALEEMDLVELEDFGDSSSSTFVLINSRVLQDRAQESSEGAILR